MHHAISDVLRIFQGGNHGKDPFLLWKFQMGLKADHIIDGPLGVVLPELDHGKGFFACLGVFQSHRFQGPVSQGIPSPAGHHLHRHTALKHPCVLKTVNLRLLGMGQLPPKGVVLLLRQGAVDVIRRPPVVSGGEPGAVHINAVKGDQGGGGVKKVEVFAVWKQFPDGPRKGLRGQRPSRDDHIALCRNFCNLPLHHRYVRMVFQLFGDSGSKCVAVYRQGPASLHPMLAGAGHNQ